MAYLGEAAHDQGWREETVSKSLWPEVQSTDVEPGTVAMWWLYQAGVIVKTAGGTTVAIDPYLSEAAYRFYRVKRTVPALIDPAEVHLDALLASHSHCDHLDPDSVPGFMKYPGCRFIGPPMAVDRVLAAGVDRDRTVRLAPGQAVATGDLEITAVFARHMVDVEPTPDAIGFIIESSSGVRLYHSGDTEYDARILPATRGVAASLLAINGTGGNMNAHEAALLAWQQQPGVAIPLHYGLWCDEDYGPGATLDPRDFVTTYRRLSPEGTTLVFQAGTCVKLGLNGIAE